MTTKENRGPRPTPVRSRERAAVTPEDSSALRELREAIRAQDAQLEAATGRLRDFGRDTPLSVSPSALQAIADAAEAHPQRSPLGWPWA